jgi:membrane-bound lytic murein transglycosylase D
MKRILSILFVVVLLQASFAQDGDSAIFSVPAVIKENVAFWKKVYTEIGLHEGVFHDRDHPLVILKRISVGQASGWAYNRMTEGQKKHIAACLRNVETQPESTWTEEEKTYAAIYREQAPAGAIADAGNRIRFQLGQKERFRMGLERSTAYLDTIRAIFKNYGIPDRIAYLPHVESSFNLESYSKVGAAGVWQFMRSTGRLFLKINYLIDERRDPILSTTAAARLLKSNYQSLGAWPLAITAYNHGVNGMKRAVEYTGSRDIETIIKNYTSPSFQFSSKNFYACFLAASDIAMHAEEYFPDLRCSDKIAFKNVKLPSYMRPSVICDYLNVPASVLREFNPAIRPVVFSQQKQLPAQYEIRVPLDIASGSMEKILARVPDSLKSSEPERSEYYTVQLGDNLNAIASRLGVSLSQLAVENNISRKNRIFEGQVLRIPQTRQAGAAATAPVVAATEAPKPIPEEKPIEPAPRRSPPRPEKKAVAAPPQTQAAPPAQATAAIDTASGADTLTWPLVSMKSGKAARLSDAGALEERAAKSPAQAFTRKETKLSFKSQADLPVVRKSEPPAQETTSRTEKKVAPAAAIADSLREIAMTAAVPSTRTASSIKPSVFPKFDVDVYNLETTLSADGAFAEIRVSTDETIGHYAEWLGIATHRVRQINQMGGRSDIRIGEPILIPAQQPALGSMMQTRLEYHMAIEEDFYGRFKVTDVKQKTLRRGEALWDICNGTDPIPLWLLRKYNKQLDFGKLLPGATIWIPVVEEKNEQEIREETTVGGGIYPVFQSPGEAPRARNIYRMP